MHWVWIWMPPISVLRHYMVDVDASHQYVDARGVDVCASRGCVNALHVDEDDPRGHIHALGVAAACVGLAAGEKYCSIKLLQ
jgi:hypothetical protein